MMRRQTYILRHSSVVQIRNRPSVGIYVAIGNPGLVDVIDTAAMRRCDQVTTEEGAHTTAFDGPRQHLIVFLPRTCRAAIYEETLRY